MRGSILTPIPFITGKYDSTGEPIPIKLRLLTVVAAMKARVTSDTIIAITPTPYRTVPRSNVRGLSKHLENREMQLKDERDCYNDIYYTIKVLNKCIRATGFDRWYCVNSLIMRQCAYVAIQFIVGSKRFKHFRFRILQSWVRVPYPGRFVAAVLSRQVGKTGIIAITLALMIALARTEDAHSGIALYAQEAATSETTLQMAINLLRIVYNAIPNDPDMAGCIVNLIRSSAHGSITVEMPAAWNSVVFHAVAKPGRVINVRGSRENAIFGDEVSFMSRDMMTNHIIPIMSVTNRVGAMMTTPGTSLEPGGDMMQHWLTDPKKNFPYGTVEQLSLVCPECYPLPSATKCRHNLDLVPPWRSIPDMLHAIATASTATKREEMERELLGYSNRRIGAVFDLEMVRQVCHPVETEINIELISHKVLYLVIDPAVGSRSNFVVYSILLYGGTLVVLAMDDVNLEKCGRDESDLVIRAHYVALSKQFPGLLDCCSICPIVESNGSLMTVTDIMRLLTTSSFPVRLKLDRNGLAQQDLRGGNQSAIGGVYTRDDTKEAGVRGLCDLAANGRLVIVKSFTTTGISNFTQGRKLLDRELLRTHANTGEPFSKMDPVYANTPVVDSSLDFARQRLIQTLENQLMAMARSVDGKISGKGARKTERDDMAMCLLIAVCFIPRLVSACLPLESLWQA